MIYAIFSTVLGSLGDIFWKRALVYKAPKEIFSLLAYTSIFLISIFLLISGQFNIENININIFLLIIFITVITYFRSLILQNVYKTDKISKILPYQNISKIITLLVGFFIFGDTSVITLIIAIITVIVIFLFSIDFKNIYIPKNIKLFSLAETLYATTLLLMGYILIDITNISYFYYSYILGIIFTLILIGFKKQFKYFKNLPKQFYGFRLVGAHLGGVSFILSLLIIKELGLTVTILVSYIGLISTLIFTFFMFKDKPSKKDSILIFLVTMLISLGYIYK